MSWLKDMEDKRKRDKEFQKRQESEVRRLDAMVCRLLNDVGEAKWGHHFSWDRSFTILPLGNVKHYTVESAYQKIGSGVWTNRWSLEGRSHETYYVEFKMGNPPTAGTSNHFEVYEWEGRRVVTSDTSETELMNALKTVVVG